MTPRPSGRHLLLAALAVAVAVAERCELEPEVGPPLQEQCQETDSDPGATTSFAVAVYPLLSRKPGGCMGCHDPGQPSPIGVDIGGLDLSGYAGLRKGGINSGAAIVLDGQPCASILVQKLSPGPPFGARMPLNGPPFFSDDELRTVRDWIAEGAQDN